jgi:hypothetical protein
MKIGKRIKIKIMIKIMIMSQKTQPNEMHRLDIRRRET